ncbi:DNA primase small subunit-like [Corticium candelabrum]|uniref:DNA primase small subunit-like n=1 Tax=Corticium candelabrum TaxID=121492 RepID=UPI002E255C21|nr:DNA primase small subunit-like [Corticium candelabrum]
MEVKADGGAFVEFSGSDLPELLKVYYKRLFPFHHFYRWLSYGNVSKTYFLHREFSFTLKDDIYVRYQSFKDQAEMEREIQKMLPYKIDIGAVYTLKPKEHKAVKATAFQPLEKELVFDIDMTDYDDVRTCCSGAGICVKCWPLMKVAVRIIDLALKDDFGFSHCLWVYSGRRGVHCWVCDDTARKLSSTARSAIAEYLSVVKGGESQVRKVQLHSPLHPSLQRAEEIVKDKFKKLALENQDILGMPEQAEKVLALIPDTTIQDEVRQRWSKTHRVTSEHRWEDVVATLKSASGSHNKWKLNICLTEIMFQYIYPRLDVNVSKGINHLLKSPFCVHPKTGRVCVPFDADNVETFDPFAVPTISQLCYELDQVESGKRADWRTTSLKKSVDVFARFLQHMEKSWSPKRKAAQDASGEW